MDGGEGVVNSFFPREVRRRKGGKKNVGWGGGLEGLKKGGVIWELTVQKDRGRKKILTKAKSLTFSPSLVDALLSITALALNNCGKTANNSHLRQRAKYRPRKQEKNLRHLSMLLWTLVSA